jgi:hypothetical protein
VAQPVDIAEFVNPAVTDGVGDLAARFRTGRPFRHVVIEDFLTPSFCGAVCSEFPAFEDGASLNEDGRPGGKATQEQVRALGPAFERMDDLLQSPAFLGLVERITGIDRLRYDPWYFGGGTHENREGQDLDPHVDFNYHPITRQHRRLNLILYLNEQWQDAWGGSLQLHRDPYVEPNQDEIVTVTPLLNRCVIFETSERSWHGFERISLPPDQPQRSRRSFAVYFYTDSRPADETADEHSTIYVERHLPDRFVPGHVLAEADVAELKALLRRRDQHLQRLYRKLQELNGTLNRSWLYSAEVQLRRRVYELEHSLSWRITAPLRMIKHALSGKGGRAAK